MVSLTFRLTIIIPIVFLVLEFYPPLFNKELFVYKQLSSYVEVKG
jgi:hypothetical protein